MKNEEPARMVELEGCCPPETGEARNLCRDCLEKNCTNLIARVNYLNTIIHNFCNNSKWACGSWKRQEHIAPLFEVAHKLDSTILE